MSQAGVLYQDPLTSGLQTEMTIITIAAGLSFLSTVLLILYLTHIGIQALRAREKVPPHFYSLFLVFNLLVGNAIESLAFVLNISWLAQDHIVLGNFCTAQGMILQVGDMLGSAFTTAIAIQTFMALVLRQTASKTVFWSFVSFVWFFSIFLGAPMPAIDAYFKPGTDYYTLAGAWCWINPHLTQERLYTHYVYVFLDQILCLVLYLWIYIRLRKATKRSAADIGRHHSTERLESTARKMILYPLAYTITTMPLAIARVNGMLGRPTSPVIVCFVGTLFSLSGLCNALLYGLTRNIFHLRTAPEKRRDTTDRVSASYHFGRHTLQSFFASIRGATPTPTKGLSSSDRKESDPFAYEMPDASRPLYAQAHAKTTTTTSTTMANSGGNDTGTGDGSGPGTGNGGAWAGGAGVAPGSIFVKSETVVRSETVRQEDIHTQMHTQMQMPSLIYNP